MVAALAACGMAAAEGRRRRKNRRAGRALHELRRPLQALLLAPPRPGDPLTTLDLALAALHDLELVLDAGHRRELPAGPSKTLNWPLLLTGAADRWQQAAWLRGGRVDVRCLIDGGKPLSKETAISLSQGLDNLILNALTHGGAVVEVSAVPTCAGIELRVADRGTPPPQAPPYRQRRRGQGLKVVTGIASRLGGSFRVSRDASGSLATISLPPLGDEH